MDLLVAETSNIAATTVSAQVEEVVVNFVHSLDSLRRQRMTMNKLLSAKIANHQTSWNVRTLNQTGKCAARE